MLTKPTPRPPSGGGSLPNWFVYEGHGDGIVHESEDIQEFLDSIGTEGGGYAYFPPGVYTLEKTVFIPSNVHIIGCGRETVLQGWRPTGTNGFALISNKGINTAPGYTGAENFSMQNLTIDTPRTNGITLVHCQNAYFGNIWGMDAFHHHFDIAGCRNLFFENIWMVGRSGTSPFQIDGYTAGGYFNNNTWNGSTNVAPFHDLTENDGIHLSNSVIHTTNRVDFSVHFHRNGGKNIFIDNVQIANATRAFYTDPDCQRENVHISNIFIDNVDTVFQHNNSSNVRKGWFISNLRATNVSNGITIEDTEDFSVNNISIPDSNLTNGVIVKNSANGHLSAIRIDANVLVINDNSTGVYLAEENLLN